MNERLAPRLRARVREALVCPYCRDAVGRKGSVVCARRACGAHYHRECWDECAERYGGCAIFGCESRKCREVSVAGYFLKLARLVLAAILFPPRLARAIAAEERSESRPSIWARSIGYARKLDPRTARGRYALLSFLLYLCVLPGVLVLVELAVSMDRKGALFAALLFVVCVTAVFVAIFSPIPVGFLLALGWNFMKLVAAAFRSELAALTRGEEGATVLGRMRSGGGKKSAPESQGLAET